MTVLVIRLATEFRVELYLGLSAAGTQGQDNAVLKTEGDHLARCADGKALKGNQFKFYLNLILL